MEEVAVSRFVIHFFIYDKYLSNFGNKIHSQMNELTLAASMKTVDLSGDNKLLN